MVTLGLEDVSSEESPILSDELDRIQAIEEMEECTGIRILTAEVDTAILSAAKIERTDTLNSAIAYSQADEANEYYYMQVYEWIWLRYDYSKAGTEDRMGYGMVHEIVAEKSDNTITIVSDSYKDGLYREVISTDYGVNYSNIVSEVEIYEVDIASIKNSDNYNVNLAVAYADTYVVQDYLEGGGQDSRYYNPNYTVYSADCCNFISQCVAAGGITESGEWFPDSATWKRVSYFVPYFTETLGYSDVTANNSTVFPGNPVYFSDLTHIGICVGYNTAGVPILNAHTSDAYHIPLSVWGNCSPRTILISTSNLQISTPEDAVDLGIVQNNDSFTGSLSEQEADYYSFSVTSTGFYDICSTGNIDIAGYVFKGSYDDSSNTNRTLYMYEIASDDDGGNFGNFSIYAYLEAGKTYYLKIVSFDESITGNYGFYFYKVQ